MQYEILIGWWLDAGENHEALLRANMWLHSGQELNCRGLAEEYGSQG